MNDHDPVLNRPTERAARHRLRSLGPPTALCMNPLATSSIHSAPRSDSPHEDDTVTSRRRSAAERALVLKQHDNEPAHLVQREREREREREQERERDRERERESLSVPSRSAWWWTVTERGLCSSGRTWEVYVKEGTWSSSREAYDESARQCKFQILEWFGSTRKRHSLHRNHSLISNLPLLTGGCGAVTQHGCC